MVSCCCISEFQRENLYVIEKLTLELLRLNMGEIFFFSSFHG